MKSAKLISIVVPAHNELQSIPLVVGAVQHVFKPLDYGLELIIVDDGSTDGTSELLDKISNNSSEVKVVHLSRNFGKEIATSAGLKHAKGEAAIMLDADLQHPPELIPQLIARWEAGADVVIGVKTSVNHDTFMKRLVSRWYYRLMGAISNTDIVPNATDFRIIDRAVLDEFNRLTDHNRMTRGLIDWLGFDREYIQFAPNIREHGARTYSYKKLTALAVNSLVSTSFFPLKLAGYLGVVITGISGPLGIFVLIEKYLLNDPWDLRLTGPAILAVMLMFMIGIVLMCLGLIALYIANIYDEVVGRPLYVERKPRRGSVESR